MVWREAKLEASLEVTNIDKDSREVMMAQTIVVVVGQGEWDRINGDWLHVEGKRKRSIKIDFLFGYWMDSNAIN